MNAVELYISKYEERFQGMLNEVRTIFLESVPDVEERIRYNMPAYKVGKYHLYFAGNKKHIGFYPVSRLTGLEDEIAPFRAKGTKDSLHFPYDKPLPKELIKKIILLESQKAPKTEGLKVR